MCVQCVPEGRCVFSVCLKVIVFSVCLCPEMLRKTTDKCLPLLRMVLEEATTDHTSVAKEGGNAQTRVERSHHPSHARPPQPHAWAVTQAWVQGLWVCRARPHKRGLKGRHCRAYERRARVLTRTHACRALCSAFARPRRAGRTSATSVGVRRRSAGEVRVGAQRRAGRG